MTNYGEALIIVLILAAMICMRTIITTMTDAPDNEGMEMAGASVKNQ